MDFTGKVRSIEHRKTGKGKAYVVLSLSDVVEHFSGAHWEHLETVRGNVKCTVFTPWLLKGFRTGEEIGVVGDYNPIFRSITLERLVDASRIAFKSYCD